MAKKENQKLKLLYLLDIFKEFTDDQHALTMAEIIDHLAQYDVAADRKTLYRDFEELREYGCDILMEKQGKSTYYHLGEREFELAELKLLVDSVQSAKFITDSKSKELIKKLESLVSRHQASQLQRQVVISDRVKTLNKMIYNNVDVIHTAINNRQQISFHYFQWDIHGNQVLRHDGALYHVSPWCLMWDDEYYYLVGYDAENEQIKHYRVDKMKDLSVTDLRREGQEAFKRFNMAKYSKSLFGMYGGDEMLVTLECQNDLAGVIFDRFGKDVTLYPKTADTFVVHVNVIASKQFLGWIFAIGGGIKIVGPEKLVSQMQAMTKSFADQYKV